MCLWWATIQFNSTKRCHSSHLCLASQLPPCTKRVCTRLPSRVAQTNHRTMVAPVGRDNHGLLSHPLCYWGSGLYRWWRGTTEYRKTSALEPEARVLYWPVGTLWCRILVFNILPPAPATDEEPQSSLLSCNVNEDSIIVTHCGLTWTTHHEYHSPYRLCHSLQEKPPNGRPNDSKCTY